MSENGQKFVWLKLKQNPVNDVQKFQFKFNSFKVSINDTALLAILSNAIFVVRSKQTIFSLDTYVFCIIDIVDSSFIDGWHTLWDLMESWEKFHVFVSILCI